MCKGLLGTAGLDGAGWERFLAEAVPDVSPPRRTCGRSLHGYVLRSKRSGQLPTRSQPGCLRLASTRNLLAVLSCCALTAQPAVARSNVENVANASRALNADPSAACGFELAH